MSIYRENSSNAYAGSISTARTEQYIPVNFQPNRCSTPTMTVLSLRAWHSYVTCTQCRWSASLNSLEITALICPSRPRITCSKKQRHFWPTSTRPCAWLFYRTNICDVMRLMPRCSCKKPAKWSARQERLCMGGRGS